MGHKANLLLWFFVAVFIAVFSAQNSYASNRHFGHSLFADSVTHQYHTFYSSQEVEVSDDQHLRDQIEATYIKVTEENRLVDFLDNTTLIELPVGLKTVAGLFEQIILIDSIVITPDRSLLYASMFFKTPYGNLHFVGSDIEVSRNGGVTGTGKLSLIGEYRLDMGHMFISLSGNKKNTYVEFGCDGYKQLVISGAVGFPASMLRPIEASNETVQAYFSASVVDLNDLVAEVSVEPFTIPTFHDFSFKITSAVLDLSDTRNPPNIRFPSGYNHEPGYRELWRGVYVRAGAISLPKVFHDSEVSTSIALSDLLIDDSGCSGIVSAQKVLTLDRGKLGGWNYSIDALSLQLASNRPIEFSFKGKIILPVCKKSEGDISAANALEYKATFAGTQDYVFNVLTTDSVEFPLWNAHVKLHPSSVVQIKVHQGEVASKAVLHGSMQITTSDTRGQADSKFLKLPQVSFQNLIICNAAPFIRFGLFSIDGGEAKPTLGGFPINVNAIGVTMDGEKIRMFLDLSLALTEEKDGGLASAGRIGIISNVGNNNAHYDFERVDVDRFNVAIDRGSFKLKGVLDFYRHDEVYGNGIRGEVDANFHPGIHVRATALFGNRQGLRYWFADVLVASKQNIPIVGPLSLKAFGGGLYYHMKMRTSPPTSQAARTKTGISYVPDQNTSFGLKAMVELGVRPGEKIFTGEALFGIEFNQHGGVRSIGFYGKGYFMSDPLSIDVERIRQIAKSLPGLPESPVTGSKKLFDAKARHASMFGDLSLLVDVERNIVHGNLSVYVNIANGLIKGSGPDKKAGEAVVHFSSPSWYIYIGEPAHAKRVGLTVANFASFNAYFVTGSQVPESPPIPAKFNDVIKDIDLDYTKDIERLAAGAGVGFGAELSVNTGDVQFMMFYGKFSADVGFDLMLRDYTDAKCNNGEALGLNGWYANGQAYAFLQGTIGIKVKVLKRTRRVPILEIGAAVLAQTKTPNPSWFRGVVGGYFNALGGLVRGTCRFEVEIGRSCELGPEQRSSELDFLEVIASITPADAEERVDVFSTPQAVFNYEIGKEFEYVNDAGVVIPFRINLDQFSLTNNNSNVDGELTWNTDRTVAVLRPFEILPPRSNCRLTMSVTVQEKHDGKWVAALSNGKPIQEVRTVSFSTGDAPDYIPASNIAYSYPTPRQTNYYQGETRSCYVKLKQGQQYLFTNKEFEAIVRIRNSQGSVSTTEANYHTDRRQIQFLMPSGLLHETVYTAEFALVPKAVSAPIDRNVEAESVYTSSNAGEIQVTRRKAVSSLRELREKVIYQSQFRTSMYSSFGQKLSAMSYSNGWRDPILPNVHAIGVNIVSPEPFALEEITEVNGNAPLIQAEAVLQDNQWFEKEINPLLYEEYPIGGFISLTNRDPETLGIIPIRATFIYQHPHDIQLSAESFDNGFTFPQTIGRVDYYLAYYMYQDFLDLADQAAVYASRSQRTTSIDKLLTSKFPYIKKGNYIIQVSYVLPGSNTATSKYSVTISNPIE